MAGLSDIRKQDEPPRLQLDNRRSKGMRLRCSNMRTGQCLCNSCRQQRMQSTWRIDRLQLLRTGWTSRTFVRYVRFHSCTEQERRLKKKRHPLNDDMQINPGGNTPAVEETSWEYAL